MTDKVIYSVQSGEDYGIGFVTYDENTLEIASVTFTTTNPDLYSAPDSFQFTKGLESQTRVLGDIYMEEIDGKLNVPENFLEVLE